MTCQTCKYHYFFDFHLTNPKKDSKHYISECHIYPPVLLPDGSWGWPEVRSNDFCGAHIPIPFCDHSNDPYKKCPVCDDVRVCPVCAGEKKRGWDNNGKLLDCKTCKGTGVVVE